MRRSLRIFLMLWCLGGVFGLPSSALAGAPRVTVGFVPGQGVVRTAAEAQTFADLLSARLDEPVKVRLLGSEAELYEWMSRYREVDLGWFSEEFSGRLTAGAVLPLVIAERTAGGALPGHFVVRQEMDVDLLRQIRDALLAFGRRPEETALLSTLDLARFSGVVASAEDEILIHPSASIASAEVPMEPAETVLLPRELSLEEEPPESTESAAPPVLMSADRLDYDNENKLVQAGGDVTLQQGETTLAADQLLWQDTTRDAVASGHVRLTEPGAEMDGDSLHANLATGMGLTRRGRVFLRERNFHLAGEEIERLGEATYRIKDGSFTTCDGAIPDWQFTAERVNVTLGRYATARNVWFEIRNKPVLYLPYLLFPVKAERESGFLLPRAGYSSRKGSLLSLAWYQVIDRNLDATLYLDSLSKIGLGKGLEFRYVLGESNAGEALAYHVTGVQKNDDTFAVRWRHKGDLPGGFRLTADVDYVDDIEFFKNFGDVAEEYNRDHTKSIVMLQRAWEHLNLTARAEYIRDLEDTESGNDATLQRLPEVNLSVPFYRMGSSPFYLRAETVLTNFVRKEGVDGLRLYVNPELSAVFKPGSWLELTPKVAAHGSYYNVGDTDGTLRRSDYDNNHLAGEYALTASTRLARIFPFAHGGFDKLKHSIEPQVTYRYISGTSQDRLPYFDAYDQIGPANRIEYTLVNRLTGRGVDADGNRFYRELLNLRLSQSYDFDVERGATLNDQTHFSALRVELQGNPTAESSLRLEALIPVQGHQSLSRFTASAGYSSPRGHMASLDYTYISDEYGTEPSDYLDLRLATAFFAPIYADFRQRYDFQEGQSLESLLNLEYRSRCWSLFLSFRNRPALDGGQDNNEIMAGFALSGLGRVGGFGSKLGAPTN